MNNANLQQGGNLSDEMAGIYRNWKYAEGRAFAFLLLLNAPSIEWMLNLNLPDEDKSFQMGFYDALYTKVNTEDQKKRVSAKVMQIASSYE